MKLKNDILTNREKWFLNYGFLILGFLSSLNGQLRYTQVFPSWLRVNRIAESGFHCPQPEGQFSHPKYCDMFLNCWAGRAVVGRCQHGLVFNERIRACDYKYNVDCSNKDNSQEIMRPPSPPPPPRPQSPPHQRPPKDPRCIQDYGTFVNLGDCSEYFVCQGGIPTVYKCPKETYYNQDTDACDSQGSEGCIIIGNGGGIPVPGSRPTLKPDTQDPSPTPETTTMQSSPAPIQTTENPIPETTATQSSPTPIQNTENPTPPPVETQFKPVLKPTLSPSPPPGSQEPDPVFIETGFKPVLKPTLMPVPPSSGTLKPKPSLIPLPSDEDELIPEMEIEGPEPPKPAGTPTLPPPEERPQGSLSPEPPSPSNASAPDSENGTSESEDQSTSEPVSSTPLSVTNLKPKPPLKPQGEEEDEDKPTFPDLGNLKPKPSQLPPDSENPGPRPPSLNPDSLQPQRPPDSPFEQHATSARPPVDGEDDPNILFPFLPKFPDRFKCPLLGVLLPVIGHCDSVVACVGGVGHRLRCPEGEVFDPEKGRCTQNKDYACPSVVNLFSDEDIGHSTSSRVVYAYLPFSKFNRLRNFSL